MNYQIKVRGYLNSRHAQWLDGFEIKLDEGNTVITGIIQDQSALFGLLKRIQEKGIHLISIQQEEKQ